MTRYTYYIFLALITAFISVSCIQELELETPVVENDVVTLVPRVQSFANKYVTKAEEPYSAYEKKISSLTALIFNSEGNFVYKLDQSSGATSLTLNKSLFAKGDMANSTVVLLANITLGELQTPYGVITDDNIKNLTVSALQASTYTPSSIPSVIKSDALSSINGLPMIGGQKGINLSASKNQQDLIEIGLKMLYAKITFHIAVADEGGENQYLHDGVKFNMTGCNIYNTTHTTTLAIPDIKDQPKIDFLGNKVMDENGAEIIAETDGATPSSSYYNSDATPIHSGSSISKGNQLDLTFYILESRFNHGVDVATIYPWKDSYGNVLEGYESYQQMYKPKLVTKAGNPNKGEIGLATNVRLSGTYTDYRGTDWNVDYTVYLGKDNAQNFQVDRNSEYTNIITIKGIRNSSNAATGDGEVWIDHRVDVSYAGNSADDCVTITRETLVDSHIEVRPLRVSLRNDYVAAAIYLPKYPLDAQGKIIYNTSTNASSWGQVQEIEGGTNENWIAIENNNGAYNKGKLYCPNGKRKYFTTSLIEELHLDNNAEGNGIVEDANKNKFISLTDGECAWIYFDENSTTNQRRARIDVVFYKSDGITVTETFDVYQAGLEESGGIKFESYEEYLHSYDFEDQYGLNTSPTDYSQQGLAWGMMTDSNGDGALDGYQLSENYIVKSVEGGEDIVGKSDRYDYGHSKDFPDYYTKEKSGQQWVNVDLTKNTGVWFTSRASAKASMTVMDMGTRPTSAYQYCLSKNKFHEDPHGEDHKMIIRWYLPDVYELQTILQSDSFDDFESEAFYWSSQPAYSSSLLGIVSENAEYARAISSTSNSKSTDFNRAEQHRIRCTYYADGIDTPMPDRIPDGLGGLIKIPMKAYESYTSESSNIPGYFSAWLTDLNEESSSDEALPSYAFPTGEAANTFEDYVINGVRYYTKDPSDKNSWSYGKYNITNNTLYYYPGLSTKEIVRNGGTLGTDLLYEESGDLKEYQRSYKLATGEQITAIPSNTDLATQPLDYLDETDYLTISLDKGTNTSKGPSYSYRREDEVTSTTFTRNWDVPKYKEEPINVTSGSVKEKVQVSYSDFYDREGIFGAYTYDIGKEYVYEGITYIITDRYYEGRITSRKYYFDLGPTTIKGVGYKYIEGTGGWGKENPSKPIRSTPSPVVDKFEFFGGNTFTITAKEGYVIRSIKINYSGSNNVPYGQLAGVGGGASNDRFLRIVETLPSGENTSPQNMSYSGDGDIGWFKWAPSSESNDVSTVTLRLVTYKVTESFSIGGINFRPASFSYTNPANVTGYASDFDTSIVIDSFEIRIGEVENAN